MRSFLTGLGFLTILPVPDRYTLNGAGLGKAAGWFPSIGLILGGMVALAKYILDQFLPTPMSSSLTVAFWIGMTGGLHLDGLADCCDGMMNSAPPDRRLEIMKDPRVGTFGVLGLILMVVLKTSAVNALSGKELWISVMLSTCLARWAILWMIHQPAARPEGLGASFMQSVRYADILMGGILPVALGIIAGLRGLTVIALVGIATWGFTRLARIRLGGLTGDVLGCTVEMAELLTLIVFAVQPVAV